MTTLRNIRRENIFFKWMGLTKTRYNTILWWIVAIAGGLLMARARVLGAVAPFAAAYFAAGIMASLNPVAMLIGCLLGTASQWPSLPAQVALQPLSCALIWASFPLWKHKKFGSAVAATLSVITLFPLYGSYVVSSSLTAALGALSAGFMTLLITKAMEIRPMERHALSQEEVASLTLLLSGLALGLKDIRPFGISLGSIVSVYMTLLLSFCGGPGMGAAGGAVLGLTLSLGGSDPVLMSNLVIGGLLAGCIRSSGRVASGATFILGNALCTLHINRSNTVIIPFVEIAFAVAFLLITPYHFIKQACALLDANESKSRRQAAFATHLRSRTASQVRDVALIFQSMAGRFEKENHDQGKGELWLETAAQGLCQNCERFISCWQNDYEKTARTMLKLADVAWQHGNVLPDDLPFYFRDICLHKEQAPMQLTTLFAQYQKQMILRERIEQGNELLCWQLQGVAQSMIHLSKEMQNGWVLEEKQARRAMEELDKTGLRVGDVLVQKKDGKYDVSVTLKACGARGNCAREAAKALSAALGVSMRPVDPCCRTGTCEITYEQAPSLGALTGVARSSAREGACGDSYCFIELSGGRYMMAISDGMGAGKRAAKESAAVISLLEQFFQAGFGQEAAIRALNRLMLMGPHQEMFTTVDLTLIDLCDGMSHLVKIGAVPSLLKRDGKCRSMGGGTLPLGILDEAVPQSQRITLMDGDVLIMASDGITEAGFENWLPSMVESISTQNPQEIAEEIMRAALLFQSNREQDDMTVMVTKIFSR